MGQRRLEQVLEALEQSGFSPELAYPGQKIPLLTQVVAAVHIERVDSASGTVTIGVTLLSPARLGGGNCEIEALRAGEALRALGGECIQKGCAYDRASQTYSVEILASFSLADSENFAVYIDGVQQVWASAFREEEQSGCQAEYLAGQATPCAISQGSLLWTIRLEEQIPPAAAEPEEPENDFTLEVTAGEKTERYCGCRWTSITRERSSAGLRRVRRGLALSREEV